MKTVLIIAGLFGLMLFLIWFDSYKLEPNIIDATVKATPQPSVSEPIEQHGMLMYDPNRDCWVEDKE